MSSRRDVRQGKDEVEGVAEVFWWVAAVAADAACRTSTSIARDRAMDIDVGIGTGAGPQNLIDRAGEASSGGIIGTRMRQETKKRQYDLCMF